MNLQPCPFCGVKNPRFNVCAAPGAGWYVRCRSAKCSARVEAGTAPAVMKRWNLRAEATTTAEISTLKSQISNLKSQTTPPPEP